MFYLYINTYRHIHMSISLPGYQNSVAEVYGVA